MNNEGSYYVIDGIEFRFLEDMETCTRGWFWLDADRGVWNGPFSSKINAYDDFKKDELLTRPV